jgi:protein gp37
MAQSKIEWTDVTDNIIVVESGGWWCRRISPGCDHCYAEGINQNKFFGGNGFAYRGAPPALKLREDIIEGWARQRKPKKHFVSSMTDVFGDWVPQWMIFRILDGMVAAPRQTFQLLTKRPGVMLREVRAWLASRGLDRLPSNIWAGVTVENQEWADKRREDFEAIPAATKFVSYEPALGPVNWAGWEFLSQIISGGESGKGARPSHPGWFHATRDWCIANHKAYFHKQHGEFAHWQDIARYDLQNLTWVEPEWFSEDMPGVWIEPDGRTSQRTDNDDAEFVYRVGKVRAGRMLDGVEWNQQPAQER